MTDTPRPSVVVVGGGYAGASVAKGLDQRADVTLVEPRDTFVHNVAALRSLVHPEFATNMFLGYERLLANGRVVHERARSVDAGRVVLDSGVTLQPDYVVLAMGSRYPYPAKPAVGVAARALEAMQATWHDLNRSQRVLVVGAGAVGIELSAEIKLAWPDKNVVLLEAGPDLLAATSHSDELRAELRRQLRQVGVDVRVNTKLVALPYVCPARLEPFSVVTTDGDEIAADIWFECFGVTPASEPLRGSLAGARRPDGTITVDDYLRVAGQTRVYALGDVSSADAKMAGLALMQAAIVVSNIKAQLRGDEPQKRYKRIGPMMMVAIGADGGAGESPMGFHGRDEVVATKSRDLLSDYFRELLGL